MDAYKTLVMHFKAILVCVICKRLLYFLTQEPHHCTCCTPYKFHKKIYIHQKRTSAYAPHPKEIFKYA